MRTPLLPFAFCALLSVIASAQIDPRTALLERSGWQAIASGDAHAAALAFREAVAADPNNARLHLGAAMAAALERRDADARAASEKALALDPTLTQARALLGQLRYRMHDLPGAIQAYEELVTRSADDGAGRAARATLERWRREAELHDRMQQSIGAHFTVAFEGPAEANLAAHAIESLDRAYWRIGQLLSVYPSEPIAVVIYTTEQFSDITRSPSWAAGAYDGTIRMPMRGALDEPEELDRVLSHEFTHALIRTLAVSGVPAWLNEGLATALESGNPTESDRPMENSPPSPRISLRALSNGFARLNGSQARLAYKTAARAARTLLEDAGGMAIANLLRDLGEGIDFDTAFEHRIQRSFADFETALSAPPGSP